MKPFSLLWNRDTEVFYVFYTTAAFLLPKKKNHSRRLSDPEMLKGAIFLVSELRAHKSMQNKGKEKHSIHINHYDPNIVRLWCYNLVFIAPLKLLNNLRMLQSSETRDSFQKSLYKLGSWFLYCSVLLLYFHSKIFQCHCVNMSYYVWIIMCENHFYNSKCSS